MRFNHTSHFVNLASNLSPPTSNMKRLLLFFLSAKLLALMGAFLATFFAPISYKFTAAYDFGLRLPYYLWVWGNFDGTHYLEVARNWYHQLEYPFFPLYPLMIRIIFQFFDSLKIYVPYITIGVVLSNLLFLAALFVAYRIIIFDKQKALVPLLFLALITYPTSFFYGAVYNDALFFLLASLTIYFSRQKSFLLASITASFAMLTRLNALALVFLIAFEYLDSIWGGLSPGSGPLRRSFSEASGGEGARLRAVARQRWWNLEIKSKLTLKEIFRSKVFFVGLVPLTFIGYLIYIQNLSGNWQDFFTSMKVWNQSEPTIPLQVAYRYLKIFLTVPPSALVFWVAVFEFLSVLFYLAMLVFSFRKIRLSYWIFFAVSILIPSLTGTFAGMPRYGLHIYPFFLSIALFLQSKPLRFKLAYFAVSLVLFLFAITLFTRGYFVS